MIFYDLDSLAQKQGINNKYLLTAAVAARARALSEQKGRTLDEDNEKFISTALQEFDLGTVRLSLEQETASENGADS
ncbi:DNA-directed RNA polymerase subunit omega [bioreactor metagenome]|jgi:DNA-directed RNA polymerase subunit K/omega|uniref:DNA-directed RNA polymerase subunit omega n=1 Tax=bioreactor metagenome TaxID=1076179 RepID=A0A645I0S7_9ZZZZ|nr:DNA-directed RNA polymerase subunit omega [Aminivibrio sp.]MBL3538579.1 DNA-directed RNA polymerase subunit omega [Aminivibrio sp.]MEA4952971.1 DNA-directed RNA polymerase subunit omega [Aminivibrio sp.]